MVSIYHHAPSCEIADGQARCHQKQMLAAPDRQISLTDPSSARSGVVAYNVPTAVDTTNDLNVATR